MASLNHYDPSSVKMAWNGINIVGPAEGSFLTVTPNADATNETVGSHGDVAITLNPDNTGTMTLRLLQNSPTNQLLSAIYNLQQLGTNFPVSIFSVIDESASNVGIFLDVHIKRPPDIEFADDTTPKEWMFFISNMIYTDNPTEVDNIIDAAANQIAQVNALLGI